MMIVDSCWCGPQPKRKKARPHRYGSDGCGRAVEDARLAEWPSGGHTVTIHLGGQRLADLIRFDTG